MSYLVLARKSRPRTFDEVIGQKAVVRTLQNALSQNRVPHALIFSGVRGVGKTTLARIMAKALNCEQGPTATPCNQCRSCREIMSGVSVDLHEVDGASNRGIQEIRELKEQIRFMPTSSRFKIIIIDEVHMLTPEAFNALLKTIEEPPEHVYFMFATTEMHRVPVTILSRCQRYELKRVDSRELTAHFSAIAAGENVEIESTALNLIVREARGSVRDGLSLLDQIFSYCGTSVSADEVVDVLGLVSHRIIADLAAALLAGDLAAALGQLDQVYTYGMDLKRFINDLLAWFRDLVVCRVSGKPEQLLDLAEEEMAALRETAAAHSVETLSFIFNVLMESLEKASFSSRPRFALELAFIRAVQVREVVPVTDILARLDEVAAGVTPGPEGSGPEGGPAGGGMTQPAAALARPETALPAQMEPGGQSGRPAPVMVVVDAKKTASSLPVPAGDEMENREGAKAVDGERHRDDAGGARPRVHESAPKDVRRHWNEFVSYVRDRKPWMAAALQRAAGVRRHDNELLIQYNDTADCRLLKNREYVTPLTEFALDFFQENFKIKFHVPDSNACDIDPETGINPQKERQALANDSLVLAAVDIFDGEVGHIRIGPRFRRVTLLAKTGEEPEQADKDEPFFQ